jgi:hypothetical protein
MIQLRHKEGTVTEIDDSRAIEILDTQGRLAVVITQNPNDSVRISTPGDPVFNAYANICKLRVSKVHIHEPTPNSKPLF